MIIFRNKKTNKFYSTDYVQNEINKTAVEYSGGRSLFEEFLSDRFTLIDLFENPLTEQQQEEIKEDFEQLNRHWAEQNILSKYEVTELITGE